MSITNWFLIPPERHNSQSSIQHCPGSPSESPLSHLILINLPNHMSFVNHLMCLFAYGLVSFRSRVNWTALPRVSWNPIQFGSWGVDLYYHLGALPKVGWNPPQPSAVQSAHIVVGSCDFIDRWIHGTSRHQPQLRSCKVTPSLWFATHSPVDLSLNLAQPY